MTPDDLRIAKLTGFVLLLFGLGFGTALALGRELGRGTSALQIVALDRQLDSVRVVQDSLEARFANGCLWMGPTAPKKPR